MPISIAIVGAGPSGFYAAAAMVKSGHDCQIDLIDALPTPYGLIRAGVAPDHQSTKGVIRAFARTALNPQILYYGNLVLGRDVSLKELRAIYDAVVLAIGAPLDRDLGIPGADKVGNFGSADFVGWFNGHPDFCDLDPDLGSERVCVIGNGNVALDIARVLVKTPAEMESSDLPDYAARAIHGAAISEVYLIGRRGPVEAKFSNKELSEMGELEDSVALVEAAQIPEAIPEAITGLADGRARRQAEKNLATFRAFAADGKTRKAKRVRFLFYAKPTEILGAERVESLRLERTRLEQGRAVGTGEFFEIPCGLVIPAIGYRMRPLEGVELDEGTGIVNNEDGRVVEGLYVVGWAKRGPVGVIGTNKADGDLAAAQIQADFPAGGKPGRGAFERLMEKRALRWVSFQDWTRIDAAEVAAAPSGAPRRKFVHIEDMLAVLDRAGDEDAARRVIEVA